MWLSFRGPVLWFLVIYVGMAVIAIRGPILSAGENWPDTWAEVLSSAMWPSAVLAIVAYVLQLVLGTKIDPLDVAPKILICDRCHRTKRRDRETKCECGGTFDSLDNWTWIDD